jgi:hypothetical protein
MIDMDPLLVTMCALAVLLAGSYVWLRFRTLAPTRQVRCQFNCPRCRHRIRFLASLAGKPGQCRRCKHQFLFPRPTTQGAPRA